MTTVSDLDLLIETMSPELNPGIFVFATLAVGERVDLSDLVALMREPEGVSVIVEEGVAVRIGLTPVFRCAWITLNVNSDLQAVGLTAAFSAVLGRAGISCNSWPVRTMITSSCPWHRPTRLCVSCRRCRQGTADRDKLSGLPDLAGDRGTAAG